MSNYNTLLALRLTAIRRERGWTQKDVCKRSGIRPTTYASWERGTVQPTAQNVARLAKVYDVSANWIVGLEG